MYDERYRFHEYNWSEIKDLKTMYGYNIPLLEDIMSITKGKIFMNLELKDDNIEDMWEKVAELIEKYDYSNQISISSFKYKYYQKVQDYNEKNNKTIVFGFLKVTSANFDYKKPNHQISLNHGFITDDVVKNAHDNGMTVAAWFFSEILIDNYYSLFEKGVDVIITDYPMKVAEQLELYENGEIYLEGCESVIDRDNKLPSCNKCKIGYQKVQIIEQDRNLCKLKYELDPDIYIKDIFGTYTEKNIIAIKMLYDPIYNETLCQKNGNKIFYFDWLFDLYDNQNNKCILSKNKGLLYTQINEKFIKKLNFSLIEIYVDDNLIDENNFICKDFYESEYFEIYYVMGAHCSFIYNGDNKDKDYYNVKFKLFDNNYISYVSYDNKFLNNEDSWKYSKSMTFYNVPYDDTECDLKNDPFQERISCINNINNCMYCKNENSCEKCNYGFTLFNEQCVPSIDYENNLNYFTPDNGTNYYTCESKMSNCELCTYNSYSFNKFHCTKCTNGFGLSKTFECAKESDLDSSEKFIKDFNNIFIFVIIYFILI